MKLLPFITVFLLMFGAIHSNEKILSKIICSFKRLVYTDIFIKNQNPDPIRLSKQMFNECNFKVRIVIDNTAIGKNDLIAFAYSEIEIKVWVPFTIFLNYLKYTILTLQQKPTVRLRTSRASENPDCQMKMETIDLCNSVLLGYPWFFDKSFDEVYDKFFDEFVWRTFQQILFVEFFRQNLMNYFWPICWWIFLMNFMTNFLTIFLMSFLTNFWRIFLTNFWRNFWQIFWPIFF